MASADESTGSGTARLLRALEAGFLTAGAPGLLRALAERPLVQALPVDPQLHFALAALVAWGAVGAGLAGLAVLTGIDRRASLWPGWLGVTAFLAIDAGFGSAGLDRGGELVALACAVVVGLALARRLGRLVPVLERGPLWALVAAVTLALHAWGASRTAAAESGASALAASLVVVATAVAALRAGLAREPRGLPRAAVRALALGSVALGSVALLLAGGPSAAEDGSPDVVLVTVDTLRADALGCYGGADAYTPNVDRLAGEGVLFLDAQSPVPMTYPSHTSLLSGLYPGNHGVLNNMPWPIDPSVETLPELFAARGYRTAAFVSGFTLKRNAARLHQRFQVYDDTFGPLRMVPDAFLDSSLVRLVRNVGEVFGQRLRRLRYGGDRPAGDSVASAVEWLERARGPVFLWVHLFDPHLPYEPPAEHARRHDPDYEGSLNGSWYRVPPERKSEVVRRPREVEHLRALYRGEVSYADEQVGVLLDALRSTGRDGNALVVVTSDHGESLGEHDYWFDHSYFLYETCTRVPLVLRVPPGLPGQDAAGERVATPVRLVDLAPTLVELFGLEPPRGELDGRSLVPLLAGADAVPGTEVSYSVTYDLRPDGRRYLLAVRDGRYKYVRTAERWDDLWLVPEREELYDLELDPGETRSVLGRGAVGEVEARLRGLADLRWEEWGPADPAAAGALSAEDRDRLTDIGY